MKHVIRLGVEPRGGCWAGWEHGQQGHREHWPNIWSFHQWMEKHAREGNATHSGKTVSCLLTRRLLVAGVRRCRRSHGDLCDKEGDMNILQGRSSGSSSSDHTRNTWRLDVSLQSHSSVEPTALDSFVGPQSYVDTSDQDISYSSYIKKNILLAPEEYF